jgi:DNA-directed RNA polymerase subunit RPC12/RpoP
MDQPLDWEPEPNMLYQCAECDSLFVHPEALLLYGDWFYACPKCQSDSFYSLATQVVWGIFWHIIAHDFTESQRMMLRNLAEVTMGPYDPSKRLQ